MSKDVTDEALMSAVRNGDLPTLGLLFERYHARLFEFLARVTGDRVAAEDLVQDIFVRVLKYRATYQDGYPFATWLFRIARNARADYFRTRAPFDPLSPAALDTPDPGVSPWRQLAATRDHDRLRRALMTLPDETRELIVLARYDGLKHDQIAALLGIGVGAVKVRIHRALRELRERFLQMPDTDAPCDVKSSSGTLQII
jgi:RNA polymerase sigma-70 factor (ECF subfamily)